MGHLEPAAWTPLHDRLHRTLRSRHLLQQQRLLVAVSGGQDSLCLIKLLMDLQLKWGWQLGVAHCNHRWRPDAEENAAYVEHLAKTWEVPFYCQTTDQRLDSEADARQWRYQALSAIALSHDYHCIVTGHTASDRAETLLHNLIRGTGADGMQALTWQRPLTDGQVESQGADPSLQLVRPLLEVTRTETAQFCRDFQLKVWEDSTNQDLRYTRNRIRQELLPYLETHFNPQVEQSLAQTSELLQAEVEYLEQAAHQLRQQALLPLGPQSPILLCLNRRVLQSAPLALQRRVMRQLLQQIIANSAPSFKQIEKLTALITAPNRSRTDPFPGGAIAEVNGDWIWLK